jgi:hypothetical protein
MMTNNVSFICAAACGLLLLTGCGGSSSPNPAGFPATVSCVLTITQEGSPLSGAMVTLTPSDGAKDWLFSGTTDESGKAKIFTYGRAEGAPKGKYKVVITKGETDPSKFTPPADENDTAAWTRYEQNAMNEKLNSYTLVERIYTDAATTPLELEITGKTAQTFDAGKKVREVLPAN